MFTGLATTIQAAVDAASTEAAAIATGVLIFVMSIALFRKIRAAGK